MSICLIEENTANGFSVRNFDYDINPNANCKYVYNDSEEKRIKAVTKVAAVSRGKDESKNPEQRFGSLLKEAAPNLTFEEIEKAKEVYGVAGRPLEFSPVKFLIRFNNETNSVNFYNLDTKEFFHTMTLVNFLNKLMPFSFLEDNGNYKVLKTNLRACINSGITYYSIPCTPIDDYRIVKVTAPYFVFAQIRTHGRLSQVAVSERVVTEDKYWLPKDAVKRIKDILTFDFIEEMRLNCIGCDECRYSDKLRDAKTVDDVVKVFLELKIGTVQRILKEAGYNKEIYNRWPNHLKYKTWIMGGYMSDPKAWPHFLLEREAYKDKYESWVQKETREVAESIKNILF